MEIRLSREYLEELFRRRAIFQTYVFTKDDRTVYSCNLKASVAAFIAGPKLILRKGRHAIIRAS